MTIRPFYDRWPQYNRRLTETIAALDEDQLAVRPNPDYMPIWAIAAHLAGTRVFWLCTIAGEPGAETTPWPEPTYDGWEDDLSHPRDASELTGALDSTFALIDRVLDTWTPESLTRQFERGAGPKRQLHDGSSILQRMLSHDGYHIGEISIGLGIQGLDPVEIWRPYTDRH